MPAYARHGVPEVWVVDLSGVAVEIYSDPASGRYTRRERLGDLDGIVSPRLLPRPRLPVKTLVD